MGLVFSAGNFLAFRSGVSASADARCRFENRRVLAGVVGRISCFCALRVRAAPLRLLAPSRPPINRCGSGVWSVFLALVLVRPAVSVNLALRAKDTIRSSPRRLVVWEPGGDGNSLPWPVFSSPFCDAPHGITLLCWAGLSERQPATGQSGGARIILETWRSRKHSWALRERRHRGKSRWRKQPSGLVLDTFTVYSFIQRDRLSPILDDDGEYVVSEEEVAALAQPKKE